MHASPQGPKVEAAAAAVAVTASEHPGQRKKRWGPPADGVQRASEPLPAGGEEHQSEGCSMDWKGVEIGCDGWRQYSLSNGKLYYYRKQGAFVETVWDRPTLANRTQVLHSTAWQAQSSCGTHVFVSACVFVRVHVYLSAIGRTQSERRRACAMRAATAKSHDGSWRWLSTVDGSSR